MSQSVHTEGKNKHIFQSLSKVWFESSAQWAHSHVPYRLHQELMAGPGEGKQRQFLPSLHPSIRDLQVCSLLPSRHNCEMQTASSKTSRRGPTAEKSCVCPGPDGNKERVLKSMSSSLLSLLLYKYRNINLFVHLLLSSTIAVSFRVSVITIAIVFVTDTRVSPFPEWCHLTQATTLWKCILPIL